LCYTHLQDLPLENRASTKDIANNGYEILVKALADLKEAETVTSIGGRYKTGGIVMTEYAGARTANT